MLRHRMKVQSRSRHHHHQSSLWVMLLQLARAFPPPKRPHLEVFGEAVRWARRLNQQEQPVQALKLKTPVLAALGPQYHQHH